MNLSHRYIFLIFTIITTIFLSFYIKNFPEKSRIISVSDIYIDPIEIGNDYYYWGSGTINASQDGAGIISGWQIRPLIGSMLDLHQYSGDRIWLDRASSLAEMVIDIRSDKVGLLAYDGRSKPQWFRPETATIFNASPYYEYPHEERDEIMSARGWQTLWFSDVNHDGLMMSALLETASRLKSGHDSVEQVEKIIASAIETVTSHEEEWHQVNEDTGYYTFPRNSPFFLDGVEMPVNEAAPFGEALTLLYVLTGHEEYRTRAMAMMNRWLDHTVYEDGLPVYPYTIGHWYNGWDEAQAISTNTPAAKPNTVPETFHKAGLTLSFANRLSSVANDARLKKFLAGMPKVMSKAVAGSWQQIAFTPRLLDLSDPMESIYGHNPAGLRGWPLFSSQYALELMSLYAVSELHLGHIYKAPILEILPCLDNPFGSFERVDMSIRPYLIDEDASDCLFEVPSDAIASISLSRRPGTNSRMLLTPTVDFTGAGDDRKGIYMTLANDSYTGRAFLKAGDCPQWQWAEVWGLPDKSQPKNDANILSVKIYRRN